MEMVKEIEVVISNGKKKPPISFDEYYSMMRAFVKDPVAIKRVKAYWEVSDMYYENGGDPLTDSREESEEVYDAYQSFLMSGSDSGATHEWNGILSTHAFMILSAIAEKVMLGEWPEMFPGEKLDIDDRESIRNIVHICAKNPAWRNLIQVEFGSGMN